MDPRRFLSVVACALALAACATLDRALPGAEYRASLKARGEASEVPAAPPSSSSAEPLRVVAMAPIPNPPEPAGREPPEPASDAAALLAPTATEAALSAVTRTAARARSRAKPASTAGVASGRAAIAEANAQARAPSRADAFEGGVQMFGYEPGRLYEVWTAPYRVTTLTLAPGETVTSKAAGDTVRWQIGETTSGSGAAQRTHVLVKPLERGLETNLVLTTSQRVYMLHLRSGADDAFNAAVAWRYPEAPAPLVLTPEPAASLPEVKLDPTGLEGRYRIEPKTRLGGRRPRWTPISVFSDGQRTVIAFPPELQVDEAPVLFVLAADGEAQVVNYRQQGGLFIVDRVFDRAELRLGAKRPEVVRITRLPEQRASR